MDLSGPAQIASVIGGLVGGLVGVGVVVEKVRGWLEAHAPRETIVPSAPQHAGSLLDQDLAALRARVTALELDRERRDKQEAAERADLIREELKTAVREMTSALRGKKEKTDDKPRDST